MHKHVQTKNVNCATGPSQ